MSKKQFKRCLVVETRVPVISRELLPEDARMVITAEQRAQAIKDAGVNDRDVTNVHVLWVQEDR